MKDMQKYLGSFVVAAMLLQGCGGGSSSSSSNDAVSQTQISATQQQFDAAGSALSSPALSAAEKAQAESDLTLKYTALYANDSDFKAFVDQQAAENNLTVVQTIEALAQVATGGTNSSAQTGPSYGLFSKVTDKLKDALVKVMDTKVGNKITGAAFDVVLNSEGVTIVMLDQARKSNTIAKIMVDAIEANWGLTKKMCPMLRDNSEFGEKFTALASEKEFVGRFFFERIDANMYGCLTDAMLLSNNDAVHDSSVKHSTNGYMALMMQRYAQDYFIMPTGSTADRRNDKFVSLLLDTGANATYDRDTKTFTKHGDGNELINEKFFYSLFKTPTSTDAFVAAMDKVDLTTRTMLMDNIFLGQSPDATAEADTIQGYMNIIAIGSAMYDGIYGVKQADGTRVGGYGFGSYTNAFIGFAGLIPSDRYIPYAKAFMNAGYEYALFQGIDVWQNISQAAQDAWNSFGSTSSSAQGAPQYSAGMGVVSSDWGDDILDVLKQSWDNVSLTSLYDALVGGDTSVVDELKDQGKVAFNTFVDGRDDSGNAVYDTNISNPWDVHNDTVYGVHGLIELAVQEDVFYAECGSRPTDYYGSGYSCDNNASYTMDNAKAAFTLPQFGDLTWSFFYNSAKDGAMAYYDNNVNAQWFADLSDNTLIRQYFYPSADNIYIPKWMLAIDWLKAANNFNNAEIAQTDLNFNAGYFDIYVVSTNPNILTAGSEIDLAQVVTLVKDIEVSKVDMQSDSIIAVDAEGKNMDGLYVYKVRAITPQDTQAVLTYLSNLTDKGLSAIGLDSTHASNVATN